VGDSPAVPSNFYDLARQRGVIATHLALFPMPNVEDVTEFLCEQDVIWVFGGSAAGLLAMCAR
jgi:peptidase E